MQSACMKYAFYIYMHLCTFRCAITAHWGAGNVSLVLLVSWQFTMLAL